MKQFKILMMASIGVILLGVGIVVFRSSAPVEEQDLDSVASEKAEKRSSRVVRRGAIKTRTPTRERSLEDGAEENDVDMEVEVTEDDPVESMPESNEQDADEKLVDAFDDLTDKWQEPSEKGVTMEQVGRFREQFRKVPKARQEECLQRALNLIPDENVMLLAGILMDKSCDGELLELIYNDVLNRDESVKKPILQEIYKDKTHPCWADTAWILDVTGELPKKSN